MQRFVKKIKFRSTFAKKKIFKGATGLYKPVGGAVANFCILFKHALHQGPFFFKIKKYLQMI